MKKALFFTLLLLLTSMLTSMFHIQPIWGGNEQTPTGWHWPTGTGDTGGMLGFMGWNQAYNGWHLAQDFKLREGQPVYALADGEVVLSGIDVSGYGVGRTPGGALVARFKTSTEEFFAALYGHLDNPHSEGMVTAGEILGYTNGYDHLHFGIHPGYELAQNPWMGYTHDESETYGWVDPVQFLSNHTAGAIPEFPSFFIEALSLFIIVTTTIVIVARALVVVRGRSRSVRSLWTSFRLLLGKPLSLLRERLS